MSKIEKINTVLHVITDLKDGGAQGVLFRLCEHDRRSKHVVISLMDSGKYAKLLVEAGVLVHCLDMSPQRPNFTKFAKLVGLIKKERPDLVQTWMYHADLLGGLAAKISGVKRVYWGIRHSNLERGKSKIFTILVARFCALLSSSIPEKIICCANKASKSHAKIGYKKSKLVVVQNGYDLSRFRLSPELGKSVRHEFGIAADVFLLGNVGRFDPLKDHSNLLHALARLQDENIEFRCLLVGISISQDNGVLVRLISKLGLGGRVLLLGQRSDIPSVMNAIDLHVLSSSSEGFPNVIAEAMACGTPCVSTDVGDASEIIGELDSCCPPGDPKALAAMMATLYAEWLNDRSRWEKRRVAGIRRISEKFSIESMVNTYHSIWFDK